MSGQKKAGAEGDRPVCNAVQNEKTGDTAPAWHRHFQTGSSKWKTRPRDVDEVEDLIDGDAAGIRGGGAVRRRSRAVRCGGGGEAWRGVSLSRSQGKPARAKRSAVIRARVTGLSPSKSNGGKAKAQRN